MNFKGIFFTIYLILTSIEARVNKNVQIQLKIVIDLKINFSLDCNTTFLRKY